VQPVLCIQLVEVLLPTIMHLVEKSTSSDGFVLLRWNFLWQAATCSGVNRKLFIVYLCLAFQSLQSCCFPMGTMFSWCYFDINLWMVQVSYVFWHHKCPIPLLVTVIGDLAPSWLQPLVSARIIAHLLSGCHRNKMIRYLRWSHLNLIQSVHL
jgi:hypothetical protein